MAFRHCACIFVAVTATNAYTACVESSPLPACTVHVTKNAISAGFPPLENRTAFFRWYQQSTVESAGEYRWTVNFGSRTGKNNSLQKDYSHSLEINIYKFPGASEQVGSFAELMSAAHGGLWKCDSAGSRCMREQGVTFTSTANADYTRISFKREPVVNALLVSKPPVAVLSGRTPEQSWYCNANVEYGDL